MNLGRKREKEEGEKLKEKDRSEKIKYYFKPPRYFSVKVKKKEFKQILKVYVFSSVFVIFFSDNKKKFIASNEAGFYDLWLKDLRSQYQNCHKLQHLMISLGLT